MSDSRMADLTTQYRPYPAYTPSGVPWLGDVPTHWEVLPGRACYTSEQILNHGIVEKTVLSLSYGQIKIRPEEKLHGLVPASFETYQLVEPGDIICRPTDLQNDWNSLRFGLSRYRGIITSAYMRLRTRAELSRRYGYLLLHTYDVKKVFYGLGSGLRQNLSWTDFKLLPCPVPPLPEQAAIVRYLDHADRRIRRYVSAKRKLIALLEEEKQAIVNRAVTRGLGPNVRLKHSGVEWLGDVPEHWDVRRLGYLATKFGSGITPRGGATVYQESGVPFLRSQNIHFDGLQMKGVARIPLRLHGELASSHIKPGDVLLNITGASIGRVCSVPDDFTEANVNQHVCIIRPKRSHLLPELLAAYLSIPMMQREIQFEQSGASREGLTLQSIRNFRVLVPPLPEQTAIVEYLERATAATNAVITRARRQIELLQEYRTRLIADVVTGKLDVREAAAQLPDEADDQDPIGESAPLADGLP